MLAPKGGQGKSWGLFLPVKKLGAGPHEMPRIPISNKSIAGIYLRKTLCRTLIYRMQPFKLI